MKCPICAAPTRVLETRNTDTHATRRTRECDNLHRFATMEVVEPAVNSGALARAERTVLARQARWARDRKLRMASGTAAQAGAAVGLSAARVKDIRQGRRRSGVPR